MAEEEEIREVTVDANGNVWSGDDLVVFENSGDIRSVGPPPSGITKGEIATVDRNGNYSFSQRGLVDDPNGFGLGSMPDVGGDIEAALSIWEKLKDVSWGDAFKGIGKAVLRSAPSLIALWSARNDPVAKAQAEALGSQAEASDLMVKAWQADRKQSEEARGSLYNALQDRMSQGAPPALMPGKVAYANPYQNVVKIGRGESGSGSPESGPGATLRDAIRSQFTDRHPNAPAQHFVQQHPNRGVSPAAGPAAKPVAGPSHDQSGRSESVDPYRNNPVSQLPPDPIDQSSRAATEGMAPRGGSYFDTSEPPISIVPSPSTMHNNEALLAEAVRAPQQRNLPDPTPDEWMRLLDNPHLMEMFKTKGVIL